MAMRVHAAVLLGLLLAAKAARPFQKGLLDVEAPPLREVVSEVKVPDVEVGNLSSDKDAKWIPAAESSSLEVRSVNNANAHGVEARKAADDSAMELQKAQHDDEHVSVHLYPPCDLATTGNITVDQPLLVKDSCTWDGEGLQVIIRAPITFESSLILKGKINMKGATALSRPCVTVHGNVSIIAARIGFADCQNQEANGGGLDVRGNLRQANSFLTVENCSSHRDGGGVHVGASFRQAQGSSAHFQNCVARAKGGGLRVVGNVWQDVNSSLRAENCSAPYGGGVHLAGSFHQALGSSVDFRSCEAINWGGGLRVVGNVWQDVNSSLRAENCSAEYGGGVHLDGSFHQALGSSVDFRSCEAIKWGGGLRVVGNVWQDVNSSLRAKSCSARSGGGVLLDGSFHQALGSSVDFRSCEAIKSGGGLFLDGNISQDVNSSLQAESCSARWGGGVSLDGSFHQALGSSVNFRSCEAKEKGGGLFVIGNVSQDVSSSLRAESSSAEYGGGVHLAGSFHQALGSSVDFRSCEAIKSGGGLHVGGIVSQDVNSSLRAENCSAGSGGGVHVGGSFRALGSSADFQDCVARETGGGLRVVGDLDQENSSLSVANCMAGTSRRGAFSLLGGTSRRIVPFLRGGKGVRREDSSSGGTSRRIVPFLRGGKGVRREDSSSGGTSRRGAFSLLGGGGVHVGGSFRQALGSSARFQNCRSSSCGGGLDVHGSIFQEDSSIFVENCTAKSHGGGVTVGAAFHQKPGSSAHFRNCTAQDNGGGLDVEHDVIQEKSVILAQECSAESHGGGVRVKRSFRQQPGSSAHFQNCRAENMGGGLDVHGSIFQEDSSIFVENCTAKSHGGGLRGGGSVSQDVNSSLRAESCSARYGGGVHLDGSFHQALGSSADFRSCEAIKSGGGLRVHGSVSQDVNSSLRAESCSAGFGGGAYVHGSFDQGPGSSAHFQNCQGWEQGGGLAVKQNVFQDLNTSLWAESCSAKKSGGGAHVGGAFRQSPGSSARFESCTAGEEGGALSVEASVSQNESSLLANRCKTGNTSGSVNVQGAFRQSGRAAMFQDSALALHCREGRLNLSGYHEVNVDFVMQDKCTIAANGAKLQLRASLAFNNTVNVDGDLEVVAAPQRRSNEACIQVNGSLYLSKGSRLGIKGCRGVGYGGGLRVSADLRIDGGAVEFRDCKAESDFWNKGGGAYVGGSVDLAAGKFRAENCSSEDHGGALYSGGSVNVTGSSVYFVGMNARAAGGALFAADSISVTTSTINFFNTSAGREGGALSAENVSISSNSTLNITDSSAAYQGGGVSCQHMNVSDSFVHVRSATAGNRGGGISTKSLVVVTGEVGVEHASASLGGGVFAWYSLDVGDGGTLHLSQCNAFQDGGGAYVGKGHVGYVQVHDLVATDCSASNGRGGGLFVEQGTVKLHRGNFTDCSAASSDGGAVYANGSMKAFHVEFISCTAKHTGGAAYIDSLEIGSAVFKSCAATQGRAVRANGLVEISDLAYLGKATQRSSGDFIKNAQASSLRIHSITCPRGSGVFADNTSTGCYVCDPGQVRLSHDVNDKCVACPDEPVTGCAETRMELRPGYMVDLTNSSNIKNWYRCPNARACPGGIVEAAINNQSELQIVKPMCREGFHGQGCRQCKKTHARADRSVLQCTKCSTSKLEVLLQMAFYSVTDASLFACAALSVLNVESKTTHSGVMLNQLMSFTAVSGSIMSAMMQSQSFGQLQNDSQQLLQGFGLAVDVLQGQTSTSDMSLECLAHYFGLDKTLFNAHCLSSIMPLVLIVLLAVIYDPWMAMVVGTNVFLPGFVAFFGKYLVMLRLRPETDSIEGAARFEFLPDFDFLPSFIPRKPCEITAVLFAIFACGVAGVGGWLFTVLGHGDRSRLHVKYLTRPYKERLAFWEVERLVRKMLLLLVKFALPTVLSPALQMEAIALILVTSLALYGVFRPYQKKAWNSAEAALLLVGLTMTSLTTCLLANDLHWAHSQGTQVALIFAICFLAGGISIGMAVLIAFALISERRQRQAAKKAQKKDKAIQSKEEEAPKEAEVATGGRLSATENQLEEEEDETSGSSEDD